MVFVFYCSYRIYLLKPINYIIYKVNFLTDKWLDSFYFVNLLGLRHFLWREFNAEEGVVPSSLCIRGWELAELGSRRKQRRPDPELKTRTETVRGRPGLRQPLQTNTELQFICCL